MDTWIMKHGYPPDYHFKILKPSINNVVESTSNDNTPDYQQHSHHSLDSIHNQYNQILQLLQHHQSYPVALHDATPLPNVNSVTTSKDGKPCIYWVIYTWATHHITLNLHNFQFHSFVPPIKMKLPNGTVVSTKITGTVHLSNALILFNVYYIPNFH